MCPVGQGLQYDFVKVLDFGLVKSKLFEEESLLTMDGTATGTPAYLAPEIAMGEKHVDGRADLYSLGCVAYFLLTGRMVFEEPTPTAMALAHVQKQPIPLSQLEVKVPAGLEQIVMRLLEKDPAKRIQSADELHRMVRSLPDLPKFCEDAARNWWQLNLPETAHATPGEHSDDLATSDNIVVGSPAGVSAR